MTPHPIGLNIFSSGLRGLPSLEIQYPVDASTAAAWQATFA